MTSKNRRVLLYVFAFSLLALALYVNFVHEDESQAGTNVSKSSTASFASY